MPRRSYETKIKSKPWLKRKIFHLKYCFEEAARDTKTNQPRQVHFYDLDPVRRILERVSKIRAIDHSFVFTYRGKPIKSIKIAMASALKKAKIEDFRFHDLRHTYNTNMRKARVPQSVIMALMGHKTDSMFRRYNSVDSSDAREAMKRLNALLESERASTASIVLQAQKGGQDYSPNPLI